MDAGKQLLETGTGVLDDRNGPRQRRRPPGGEIGEELRRIHEV
jgi:hypothetical protein